MQITTQTNTITKKVILQ
ncbi:hypothetical protein [uncultured Dokdonia sp.]